MTDHPLAAPREAGTVGPGTYTFTARGETTDPIPYNELPPWPARCGPGDLIGSAGVLATVARVRGHDKPYARQWLAGKLNPESPNHDPAFPRPWFQEGPHTRVWRVRDVEAYATRGTSGRS